MRMPLINVARLDFNLGSGAIIGDRVLYVFTDAKTDPKSGVRAAIDDQGLA